MTVSQTLNETSALYLSDAEEGFVDEVLEDFFSPDYLDSSFRDSITQQVYDALGTEPIYYNAQYFQSYFGTDLIYDDEGLIVGGTITDFSVGVRFNEWRTGAHAQTVVVRPDDIFAEGINVLAEVTDGKSFGLVNAQFSYPLWLTVVRTDAGVSKMFTTLGGSDSFHIFDERFNTVRIIGDNIAVATGAGDDKVEVLEDGGDLWAHLGFGADEALGGAEHDHLIGGLGDDTLTGNAGDDRLFGGQGDDQLYGGDGHDKLMGGAGNDVIYGGAGDDFLRGGTGRDVLIPGEGDSGVDILTGGAGADLFKFFTNTYDHQTYTGQTVINDYDPSEDMLSAGPSNNGTWTAEDAYTYFSQGAVQTGDDVLYTEGDYSVLILNTALSDLSEESFIDGPMGGFFAWGDLG